MLKLPKRLSAIARLVPKGSRVLDVGTDHGYVPVWLVLNGVSPSAIASDVSENCIARTVLTIRAFGAENNVRTVVADGLAAAAPDEYDTAVIAGMGGETIADILLNAPPGKRFILQPMSKPERLLAFLKNRNFTIEAEHMVHDRKKTYLIQVVRSPLRGDN
jgi:tRNA (adenine22-N1)-methyltransferase